MLTIETANFGILEVKEDQIITFRNGLPGFESYRRFFLHHPFPDTPFSSLQSVEDGQLAFVVVDPFVFFENYAFDVPKTVEDELELEHVEQVLTIVIVTVLEHVRDATANLMAPIVINQDRRLAKQVIIHDSGYTTRHRLISDEKSRTGEGRG